MNEHIAVFLNHAGQARLPVTSAEAAKTVLNIYVSKGSLSITEWNTIIETGRHRAATLLGTSEDTVAFTANTTTGIRLAMELIPFQHNDRVLVAGAFPASIYPWKFGYPVGIVPEFIPWETADSVMERIYTALQSGSVRAVFADWVHYATGRTLPVTELYNLCRSRDSYLVLDAIQGLGVLPSPVGSADIVCAGGAKWLMGTEGTGLVYVNPERQWNIGPVGWLSRRYESYDSLFPLRSPLNNAGRFEAGTLNVPGIAALSSSLKLLLDHDHRFAFISSLVEQIIDGARTRGLETSVEIPESGIVGVKASHPERTYRSITERGITLSLREGWLRVSPHIVNTADDISSFWTAFDSVAHSK